MTPVTKQDWIDALRSGEFNQCTGALAKRDPENSTISYCCLGVLATIAGVDAVPQELPDWENLVFDFDGKLESGVIPEAYRNTIVSDLDLSTLVAPATNPLLPPDDLMRTLSSMNDKWANFEDIAAYLEELA